MEEAIKKVLETPYWPPELKTDEAYFRTQDDCDGNEEDGICVSIDKMGDVWLYADRKKYRFRTLGGGGKSLRVRNALLLLAIAIKKDNELIGL